jgi:hypothetical protein
MGAERRPPNFFDGDPEAGNHAKMQDHGTLTTLVFSYY